MTTALTIEDVQEWHNNYCKNRTVQTDLYKRNEAEKIYGAFHHLLNFYWYKENCVAALEELKKVTALENFLETDAIKEWATYNEWLGSKKMLPFLIDHKVDFESGTLEIERLKILVELKSFMPLVVFYEVFKILYRVLQLHLPEERKFDNPGYYYMLTDSAPAELSVREWLCKY